MVPSFPKYEERVEIRHDNTRRQLSNLEDGSLA